ncbi:MAG: hypothetical protein K9N23_15795, partial [Akkermansiaceae bacterium]|nr:hypothetical protein [Akkermansiaceae bacterium]
MTDSRWFSRTGRVLVLILAPIQPLAAVDYHVAPGGNDAWSGLTATPNAAGDDGPLATLTAARDAVRRYRAAHPDPEPVRVLVAGGSYALTEPFQLGPEDGGTAAAP